ncbi:MAG: hypothetical protein HQ564_04005 [Candidatus Saganbacteria bacterium]|nr:hypothetical protein [Candidatus Saganbacteria bacterium]
MSEQVNQKPNYDVARISGHVVEMKNIVTNAQKHAATKKPFISILENKFKNYKAEPTIKAVK